MYVPASIAGLLVREAESLGGAGIAVPLDDDRRLVFADIPNTEVGRYIQLAEERAGEGGGVVAVVLQTDVLPLRQPITELGRGAIRTTQASPLEVTAWCEQGLNAWRALIPNAVFSGTIAAWAVLFDVPYLLIGAMMVAPMGTPAIIAAVGIALGDSRMLVRSLGRIAAGLLLLTSTAMLLGALYGMDVTTRTMEEITRFSMWTVVLAVIGGAAGAQSKVQMEQRNLIGGIASGFLIAVTLSPPAAVLGLSVVVGRTDFAAIMGLMLVLNASAVVLGAAATLRAFGITPSEPGVARPSAGKRALLLGILIPLVIAAVLFQNGLGPAWVKSDLVYDAIAVGRDATLAERDVVLLDTDAEFVRHQDPFDDPALLIRVVAQRRPGSDEAVVKARLRSEVVRRAAADLAGIHALVDVTLIPPDGQ